MALTIGDIAPDFEANTTDGRIRFHDHKQYPEGWNAPRPYLRIVPQPVF